MKTRKVPKFRKEYRLDLWDVRAIQLAMLHQGVNNETVLIKRLIKQVLKHKKCPSAKGYMVDKKKSKIEVFCKALDNWVDATQVCLNNCLLAEFKTGKRMYSQ